MLMIDDQKLRNFIEGIVLQMLNEVKEKPTDDRWFNLGESAEYLGISRNTLKKFIVNGDLEVFSFGGIKRVSKKQLDELVSRRR